MEIDNDELAGRRDIAERLSATPPTPPSLDELQQRRGIAELLSATPRPWTSLDELQQLTGIAQLLSATPTSPPLLSATPPSANPHIQYKPGSKKAGTCRANCWCRKDGGAKGEANAKVLLVRKREEAKEKRAEVKETREHVEGCLRSANNVRVQGQTHA